MGAAIQNLTERLSRVEVKTHVGHVVEASQDRVSCAGLSRMVRVGAHLRVLADGARFEVTAIRGDLVEAEPLERASPPAIGARIRVQSPLKLSPSPAWFGQRIDGFGRVLPSLAPAPSGADAAHAPQDGPIKTGHIGLDQMHPLVPGGVAAVLCVNGRARAHVFRTIAARAPHGPVIWLRLGAWEMRAVSPNALEVVGLPALTARGLEVTLSSALDITGAYARQGLSPLLLIDGLAVARQEGQDMAQALARLRHALPARAAALVGISSTACAQEPVEAQLSGVYAVTGLSETGEPVVDLAQSWSLADAVPSPEQSAFSDAPDLQAWHDRRKPRDREEAAMNLDGVAVEIDQDVPPNGQEAETPPRREATASNPPLAGLA